MVARHLEDWNTGALPPSRATVSHLMGFETLNGQSAVTH